MNDVWKYEYPSTNGYTWCYANEEPKSRIDYVVTNELRSIFARKFPRNQLNGSRMSDHRYLIFTFNTSKTNKGPGY